MLLSLRSPWSCAALLLFLHNAASAEPIYTLNESEYSRMPALYALDEYEWCVSRPGGLYCVLDAELSARNHSALMDLILDYSADRVKHFNHTQIHRGVCVTTSCAHLNHTGVNIERSLTQCLNESIWEQYSLQVSLLKLHYCIREGVTTELDWSDVAVAVLYLLLILLNIIGSFYDIVFCKNEKVPGNRYLLSWSVSRNWRHLVSPSASRGDPRRDRLKAFHGLRSMTMVCVFFSHTVLIMAYSYVDNPLYIEKSYEDPLKQLLLNGSLVTHTFFVMSSFLLAYNYQLYAETHTHTWTHLPKGILLRWLRLTPTYALVLASISTWCRHVGAGPLWGLVVQSEAAACRRYWWAHLLYINNYVYDDALCAPQTWYLAADTQLFCVGMALCVMWGRCGGGAGRGWPRTGLVVLFVASLLVPALHTYLQELDAVVLQSPETYRSLYSADATFRELYIRGHTNLSTYTLGLAGGYIAYHYQTQRTDLTKYKRYAWVVWCVFPLGVCVLLSGGLFYRDGPPPPAALTLLYAALYKPVFQLLVLVLILSCLFKIENVYRRILEWEGWCVSARVSYCAFLLHTVFQRALVGSLLAPLHITHYMVITVLCATILMSFLCGCVLHVCVEAPAAALCRALLAPPERPPDAPPTAPEHPLSVNDRTTTPPRLNTIDLK